MAVDSKNKEKIEINLDDGFGEDRLNELEKALKESNLVIGIKNGGKFVVDEYHNGLGYLIKKSGKEIVWAEFEIHGSDEKGYKLEQTEAHATSFEAYILKLKKAGII